MDDSLHDDMTARSLIQHASQEVPQYSTPIPVLQPAGKKSKKRLRSSQTITRPSIDPVGTPRTLICGTQAEKTRRKSSLPAFKEDEILRPQREKSVLRRSRHDPVEFYEDISVDENEITGERLPLPDVGDISAIVGCRKKPKLQLGKLDNRAYTAKQTQRKSHRTANESPLEEEYDCASWNSSNLSRQTRQLTFSDESDSSGSDQDGACNVNFNTEPAKGSPLSRKQKSLSGKQMPAPSSDSDATLPKFPMKSGVQQKSRISAVTKNATNVLSVSHPLSSSGALATPTSGRQRSDSRSSTRTLPLTGGKKLSRSLQLERQDVLPSSAQRIQTSKISVLSRFEASSGDSDADEESLNEEDETAQDNGSACPPEDVGESEEMLPVTAVQASAPSNLLSQLSTKAIPSNFVPSRNVQVSLHDSQVDLVEEVTEDQGIDTYDDAIAFIEMPEDTTRSGQENAISRSPLSKHATKSASRSKSYNINDKASTHRHGSPQFVDEAMQPETRTSGRKITNSSRNTNELLGDRSFNINDKASTHRRGSPQFVDEAMQRETRTSSRKVTSSSRNANELLANRSSAVMAKSPTACVSLRQKKIMSPTSVSQGSVKAASISSPYNINLQAKAMRNASHGSSSYGLEAEEGEDEPFSDENTVQKPKTSKTATLHQKSSRTPASRIGTTRSSSSLYNIIINQPDTDMHGSPLVLEDASYQAPQTKIPVRKVINVSRKSSSGSKMSRPGGLTSEILSTGSGVSDNIKKKLHSTAIHDRNTTTGTIHGNSPPVLEDSPIQALHQTDIVDLMAKTSEAEHLKGLKQPVRSSVLENVMKKMRSTTTTDHSTAWETVRSSSQGSGDALCEVPHEPETSDKKTVSASRKAVHAPRTSESEQLISPKSTSRSRVSGGSKKKMHSTAITERSPPWETVQGSSQVSGAVLSHVPHHTETDGREVHGTSKKVGHSARMSELERSANSVLSAKSGISGSIKKKMHSTAIPDHNDTMKTIQGNSMSMSPIRKEAHESLDSSSICGQLGSPVHVNSDEEKTASSVSNSSECEQSPDRGHDKELTLPPSVQNHDEEPLSEDEVATSSAAPVQEEHPQVKKGMPRISPGVVKKKKKHPVVEKKMPRISAGVVKRTVEHFAGMKLSKGALNTVMESCDLFWENTFAALQDYASHANREESDVPDVELLMYRQGLIHDRNSLNALIAEHMPMELRREVIPMATPGNIVIP